MSGLQSRDDNYTKPGVPDELKWQPVMRGYPEDVEVLTEVGWVLMKNLYQAGVSGTRSNSEPLFAEEKDWSQEHKPLREGWHLNKTKFQQPYDFAHHNQVDFTKWVVGDQFPRLATLSPEHVVKNRSQSGGIIFQRPEFATRFLYSNLQLVHLKRRGVDLAVPRFTDMFIKNRFQSHWMFTVADDFCVVRRTENAYKNMVNRFSPSGVLYGDVDVERVNGLIATGGLHALMKDEYPVKILSGTKHANRERIWEVYPHPPVRDPETGTYKKNPSQKTNVECYNFVFSRGTSHTLIVRRAGHQVDGEKPHTTWVGYPVVVGDGYDKNMIHVDRVEGMYDAAL
jgi:hypothetical protein